MDQMNVATNVMEIHPVTVSYSLQTLHSKLQTTVGLSSG